MSKEIVDGKKVDTRVKSRYPKIEFDKLKIYFGIPYIIDVPSAEGTIEINVPKMRKFVLAGEKRFMQTLNVFTTNTTEYRLPLWDAGIDWNDISDFELFCMLYTQIDNEISETFISGIDFSDFELMQRDDTLILYNSKLDLTINEEVYQHIAQYLRLIFRIDVVEKLTKDSNLKTLYINKDRSELENKKKKKDTSSHSIQPIISACVNHPGFKYNLQQVLDMSVYEFYDSVERLNIYENTTAVLRGMYSGFVDGSKFSSNDYNFMKET